MPPDCTRLPSRVAKRIPITMSRAVPWRRRRGPLAAFLLFVGTLFPSLGFLNVYPFVFSYVADHFQYLACLGILAPVASMLTAATARLPTATRRAIPILGGVLLTMLAVGIWAAQQRGRAVWCIPLTFVGVTVTVEPTGVIVTVADGDRIDLFAQA